MRLTDRDKAILLVVSRYRFLATSHILSLVPGSRQNIVRRLQRLYHAGFLDRPRAQLPLRYAGELSEFVYSPTSRTLSHVVSAPGATDSRGEVKLVSSLFLAHSLAVSDALIRFESDCRLHSLTFIAETEILATLQITRAKHFAWRVTIKSGSETETVSVIPDAAFAIERTDDSGRRRRLYFFLEADRGTMPIQRKSLRLSSIRRKALAYSRSRSIHLLKETHGIPGFQVIFIARSQERMEHIKNACDTTTKGYLTSLFLFATPEQLRAGHSPIA